MTGPERTGDHAIDWPEALLRHSPVRVVAGPGRLDQLGRLARDEGARRVLLVTDPGLVRAGHATRATALLRDAGLVVELFDGTRENPTTEHVAAGLAVARDFRPDLLVAVGGGSAMDCCKGVNLLYSNGGQMADYRGDAPAEVLARRRPCRPSILVPTTAGTGSEAQSFALISDAATKQKLACGDRRPPTNGGLRPRVVVLDPELTATVPRDVAAAAAIDAVSHAVETAGCRVRNEHSRALSRAAWERLSRSLEIVLRGEGGGQPAVQRARFEMLLGAHLAGCAIEQAMLGAAHACANPLTARFGITHGVAVGVMLPHVVRFNAPGSSGTAAVSPAGDHPYADLEADAAVLAARIEQMLETAGLPRRLRELAVPQTEMAALAGSAAAQWTAGFNPRPLSADDALALYGAAM